MKRHFLLGLGFVLGFGIQANAADLPLVRWTGADDADASISHVLSVLSQKTGKTWTAQDFLLQEDRDLAFTHYSRYEQIQSGVPVDGKSIRVWTSLKTGATVQVEAVVDVPTASSVLSGLTRRFTLSDQETVKLTKAAIRSLSEDTTIRDLKWKDRIVKGSLVRLITVKGKRGKHTIAISHLNHKVSSARFEEFPQADTVNLPAMVYPIYEEVENDGTLLTRKAAVLTRVFTHVQQVSGDLYAPIKAQRYFDTQYSPVLGATAEGRAKGYWSMSYLKEQAAKIRAALPITENTFNAGLLLQGEFATINLHPDSVKTYTGLNFSPKPSTAFFPNWIESQVSGATVNEMVPETAYYGKALLSSDELLTRAARRLPDHDPTTYMNDGFDEIQVYYAINTLMEELNKRGFTDPDLSTRPFNAFLFNPDISYRDNAFYTDDTINFTTYSPASINMARDNSTIWHELGHGVMDRLMGDSIQLADTGGLSEGMADFCAAMVVRAVTEGAPFPGSEQFRIINHTGFFLTNESHDDGEAYGGAMKDFLDAATAIYGQDGLAKVSDVILEAMRLTRDHPALTAKDWFDHILFADSLGREGVRAPGELSALLIKAINGRNFRLDGGENASFTLKNETNGKEVVAGAPGSRYSPITLNVAKDSVTHIDLSVALKSSPTYTFKYPLTVRVTYAKSPLQGAVHWIGKEKGPTLFTMNSEADLVKIPLDVSGTCDSINRPDGSCSDYVHVQILNEGETDHPKAKKRFYVRVKNP